MCLIIVKKSGTPVSPELFKSIARSYYLRNSDGMGFSIKKNGKVYLSKGYFDLKLFIKTIKSFNPKTNDELLIHLRKVSSGIRNKSNCHPYVCSKGESILQEEGWVDQPVIAHNGTFVKFKDDSGNSDTYNFIQHYLSDNIFVNILPYLAKKDPFYVNSLLNQSRVAIMYPKIENISKTILLLGRDWIECKSTGLFYSNESYKGKPYNMYGHYQGGFYNDGY